MKKLMLVAVLLVTTLCTQAQNAEEILAKLTTALGGAEKLNAISTLQYNSTLKLSAMGFPIELSINQTKEKGKLSRTDVGGFMGMPGTYTIITDTATYVSMPSVPAMGDFGGMQGGIKKLDKETTEAAKPQLSCNGHFINLLNYKENGATIKYDGLEKFNKIDCYKLQVVDKNGEKMVYFINSVTNLVDKCEAGANSAMTAMTGGIAGGMGAMGGMAGDMKNTKVVIVYSDYVTVNGVKFPSKEVIQAGANDIDLSHSNFVINEPVNAKLYIAN